MAKHVESAWSAKAGESLDYGSALGITAGSMCFYPMLEKAEKAMEDAAKGVISRELEETILNIIISPGIVSVSEMWFCEVSVHLQESVHSIYLIFLVRTGRHSIPDF